MDRCDFMFCGDETPSYPQNKDIVIPQAERGWPESTRRTSGYGFGLATALRPGTIK
jgi:hypothetical protein